MNIKLITWVVAGLFVGAGLLWYLLSSPSAGGTQYTTPSAVTLPASNSAPVTPLSTLEQKIMTVAGAQGKNSVVTNDFVHNGITVTDPSNKGNYYLTGVSGRGYSIGYRIEGQFFTIALEREPLGETRKTAETFLMATLGINQAQMCTLHYYLGTDVHTNSFFGGKSLGFSFCPGAVVLPTK